MTLDLTAPARSISAGRTAAAVRESIHTVLVLVGSTSDVAAQFAEAVDGIAVVALPTGADTLDVRRSVPSGVRDGVLMVPAAADPLVSADAYDRLAPFVAALRDAQVARVRVFASRLSPADLVQLSAPLRSTVLDGIEAATPFPARRPTKQQSRGLLGFGWAPSVQGAGVVDFDQHLIVMPSSGDGQERVLMNASVRIVRTMSLWDDLNDPRRESVTLLHDLEVTRVIDGRPVHQFVPTVQDRQLGNPREWLARLGEFGARITLSPGAQTNRAIEMAVRDAEPEISHELLLRPRTGWLPVDTDGGRRYVYLLHEQSIGADGDMSAVAQGRLRSDKHDVHLPLPESDEQRITDARAVFDAVNELASDLLGAALLGPVVWSFAGLGVGCGVWLHGGPGSGKTTTANLLAASHMGAAWGEHGRSMATFDGTKATLRDAGIGLHASAIVIDDDRERHGRQAAEDRAAAIDQLSRRAYSGHGAGATKMEKTAGGSWVSGRPDGSDVCIIAVGEHAPVGVVSMRERWFQVEMPAAGFRTNGNAERFQALLTGDRVPRHAASLIQYLAAQIDVHGLEQWKARWNQQRQDIRAQLESEHPNVSRRYSEVASIVPGGVRLLATYWTEIGAISEDEARTWEHAVFAAVSANIARQYDIVSSSAPLHVRLIAALQGTVASGRATVTGTDYGASVSDYAPVLGRVLTTRAHGDLVCLLPSACVDVLRSSFTDLTADSFTKAFEPIAVRNPNRADYQVKWNNGKGTVATVAFPRNLFDRDLRDDDPTDGEPGEPAPLPVVAQAPHPTSDPVRPEGTPPGSAAAPAGLAALLPTTDAGFDFDDSQPF